MLTEGSLTPLNFVPPSHPCYLREERGPPHKNCAPHCCGHCCWAAMIPPNILYWCWRIQYGFKPLTSDDRPTAVPEVTLPSRVLLLCCHLRAQCVRFLLLSLWDLQGGIPLQPCPPFSYWNNPRALLQLLPGLQLPQGCFVSTSGLSAAPSLLCHVC